MPRKSSASRRVTRPWRPTLIVLPRSITANKIIRRDRSSQGKPWSTPSKLTCTLNQVHRKTKNKHGIAAFGHEDNCNSRLRTLASERLSRGIPG